MKLLLVAAAAIAVASAACSAADDRDCSEACSADDGDPAQDEQGSATLHDRAELSALEWSSGLHERACSGEAPEAPPREPGRFVDVSAQAGVAGPETDSCPDEAYECNATSMTGGAAAGDFDGDGFVDLYVTRIRGRDSL